MINFIAKRKIGYTFSLTLFILSIICLSVYGLNFGIDFKGGSILEMKFLQQRPDVNTMTSKLSTLGLGEINVQPVGGDEMIFRTKELKEDGHQKLVNGVFEAVKEGLPVDQQKSSSKDQLIEELRFDSIGPSIGTELRKNSIYAIILALIAIISYITFAFRKVSYPIASWKYGLIAVLALIHDVTITIGFFSAFGHFLGIEINTPFVAAILTVLGFSVHDTIVIFDRIRENLFKSHGEFEETVNNSLNQTLARSINTTLTTLIALTSVLIFGGSTVKDFALALLIGIFFGAYSSIFIAGPLLVTSYKMQKK